MGKDDYIRSDTRDGAVANCQSSSEHRSRTETARRTWALDYDRISIDPVIITLGSDTFIRYVLSNNITSVSGFISRDEAEEFFENYV